MWTNLLSFASVMLILSTTTVIATPISVSAQIEILRISGVDERDIEQSLNPNHALASAHDSTIPRTATPFTAPQQFLLSALSSSSAEPPAFETTIDAYSTAKSSPNDPTSASASLGPLAFEDSTKGHSTSLGAFERVRRWMSRRGSGTDDPIIVTGRLGDIKIRGRR